MFTEEDVTFIQNLCDNNPDVQHLVHRYEEEHHMMLSHITHEIRNPLTLVCSTLQLIAKKNPAIVAMDYWKQLDTNVQDMISLLDTLSNYTHCETLHKSNVDLLVLLTDLKIGFQSLAEVKGATLTLKVTNNSRKYITSYYCDYIKIKQVLTNIIKNALEAVNYGGCIHLTADADKHSDQQSYLQIIISNNGDCIPAEDITKIFNPFVTNKSYGTGLGLSIASKIIMSHGGLIQVSSSEELTSFNILLPYQC